MWATKYGYGNSMKWHLADATTLEKYEAKEYNWDKRTRTFIRVSIICPVGRGVPHRIDRAKVKDTIDILQNNVCAYCRKKVLKESGFESRILK